jgi:hypothetical protein
MDFYKENKGGGFVFREYLIFGDKFKFFK